MYNTMLAAMFSSFTCQNQNSDNVLFKKKHLMKVRRLIQPKQQQQQQQQMLLYFLLLVLFVYFFLFLWSLLALAF